MIYPELPTYSMLQQDDEKLRKLYRELSSWSAQLKTLLEIRDNQVDSSPSTKVYSVVTVTSIGRPANGDIAYSLGEGKFKGYVSGTGWTNFN